MFSREMDARAGIRWVSPEDLKPGDICVSREGERKVIDLVIPTEGRIIVYLVGETQFVSLQREWKIRCRAS